MKVFIAVVSLILFFYIFILAFKKQKEFNDNKKQQEKNIAEYKFHKVENEIDSVFKLYKFPNNDILHIKLNRLYCENVDFVEGQLKCIYDWKKKIEKSEKSLISKDAYGSLNNDIYSQIHLLKEEIAIEQLNTIYDWFDEKELSKIITIDSYTIVILLWYFAMKTPFSVELFEKATKVYNLYFKEFASIEIFMSDLYTIKKLGNNSDVLKKLKESMRYKLYQVSEIELVDLSSFLNWLKCYDSELFVLKCMMECKMEMSFKLQKRLQSLSNGGADAPIIMNVKNEDTHNIIFDVSPLNWNEAKYKGFFDNLYFEEKILEYCLAIRDEDKELILNDIIHLPLQDVIVEKIKKSFLKEYGNIVKINSITGIAMSNLNKEKLEGIIVQSDNCKQMGVFMTIVPIGKKINIKFYTLFMPKSKILDEQIQQINTMVQKISPITTMWENSIKNSLLVSIQNILNDLVNESIINHYDNNTLEF